MATPPDPAIIVSLGYDPSDNKKGLRQALADGAQYKAQAVLIYNELKRTQAQLASQYTADNKKEINQRINDARTELASANGAIASKRGAERAAATARRDEAKQAFIDAKAELENQKLLEQKVRQLNVAYVEATAKARTATAAAGVFRETGRITGEIPGLSDLLQNVSPALTAIQARVSSIFHALVILGGGVQGGTDAVVEGTTKATSGVAVLEGGFATLAARAASLVNPISLVAGVIATVGSISTKAGLSVGEWADTMVEMGQTTGLTAHQLEGLEFVGTSSRLTIDEMVTSMKFLAKAMEAGNPQFTKLKIATKDASNENRNLFDVLMDVGDAIKNAKTEADRLTISAELLGGRTGTRLIPTFLLGRDALKGMFDEARDRGAKDIEGLANQFNELQKVNARVETSWHRMQETIGDVSFWTAVKQTYADVLDVLNNAAIFQKAVAPSPIPKAVLNKGQKQFTPDVPQITIAPRFTEEGLPKINVLPTPIVDPPNVAAARRELAAAQTKELSTAQQLKQDSAELNSLKAKQAEIEKSIRELGPGVPFGDQSQQAKDLVSNLNQQKEVTGRINELNNKVAEQRKEALQKAKELSDELTKQANQLSDLDIKEDELLKKRTGELTLAQKISENEDNLAQARVREATLADAEARLAAQRNAEASAGNAVAEAETGKVLIATEQDRAAAIQRVNDLLTERLALIKQEREAPLKAVTAAATITDTAQNLGVISTPTAKSQFDSQLALLDGLRSKQLDIVKATDQQDATYADQLALLKAIEEEIDKISKSVAEITLADFSKAFELTKAKLAARVITPAQAVPEFSEEYKTAQAAVTEQMRVVQDSIGKGTEEYQRQLALLMKMEDSAKNVKEGMDSASKLTGFAGFLNGIKSFSDVVGKFDSGLNRNLVQMFALVDAFGVLNKQMQNLSGSSKEGAASFIGGLKAIFHGGTDATGKPITGADRIAGAVGIAGTVGAGIEGLRNAFSQGGASGILSGVTSGAAMGSILGPIGSVVGAVAGGIVGVFGAIFGGAKKRTAELAAQVMTDFGGAVKNIDAQLKGLQTTAAGAQNSILTPPTLGTGAAAPSLASQVNIAQSGVQQLLAQRASAVAQLQGRKGGMDQLNKILPQMDQQIQGLNDQLLQLKQRQQDVLANFSKAIDFSHVAEGAQSAAQALAQIASTLKEAADAGASAAQQMDFLNASVQQLTTSLGRDLRSAEQSVISQLNQEIDLQKQAGDLATSRAQAITDANAAIAKVRRQDGLERVLTPAQQAAVDIAAIIKERDAKLKDIDDQIKANNEQQLTLEAQLGTKAQLFNLTADHNQLLAVQLDLEKQIADESAASLAAQLALFTQLAAGQIPSIPGVDFSFLNGSGVPSSSYSIDNATIQIVLPSGSNITPEVAADIVRQGLQRIGEQNQSGLGG